MALRIRFQYQTGSSLGYSIERLSDGTFFDFSTSAFSTTPTTLIATLPEDSGNFAGRYKATLTATPVSQFTNGNYVLSVHNTAAANIVVGELVTVMINGDDGAVSSAVSSVDPWATPLPGSYAPGTAGSILGSNLDAKVSTRSTFAGGSVASVTAPVTVGTNNDKTGYTLAVDPWAALLPGSYAPGTAGSIIGSNLDAKVSTRSTFAGGSVASVTAPVTVGTNNDKTGYVLAAAGLDAITIEAGVNARQALSPILAASAGVLLGSGTGTIIIKGGSVSTTRITATVDNVGNRTAVTLSLPT
jgi:hypothetical protein